MSGPNATCLLISDFTVGGLVPFLMAERDREDGGPVNATVAPFDQVTPVLLDPDHQCWRSQPDVAVVWTRPQGAIRAYARLLEGEAVDGSELLAEVDAFAGRLRSAAGRAKCLLVPTWTLPPHNRGLGLLDLHPAHGHGYHLLRMNLRLAEAVANEPNIFVLDAARWVAAAGPAASHPKLWYLGKIAFGPDVMRIAAGEIRAALRAVRGGMRKLLLLDLDETLWGGVVGDVGWESLRLGGHDPVGEAFVDFQRGLRALKNRGVLLGIVSRNTESVALEAIDRHPEMALRRDDFVAWRINWEDKAANILDLVHEVNLGLDATVFLDDNPAERARVREALPQVLVPDWPSDRLLYAKALASLDCFDAPTITREDRKRTRTYVAERERSTLASSAQSLTEFLRSLNLEVVYEELTRADVARAAQLLNKTNQMNLTTRRMAEAELFAWSQREGNCVFVFRVADRFSDYGLTGIASLGASGRTARVEDFVLSCRVIGRGVERAMLHALVEHARARGFLELGAQFRPTERNGPCRRFLDEESGLRADADRYAWDLSGDYPPPEHVAIRRADRRCT